MNDLYDNHDYLNVQKKMHLRLSKLREKYGRDNVWLCDAYIEFLVG